MRIKVNGKVYGSGGIRSSRDSSALRIVALVLGMGMLVGGIALFVVRRRFLQRKVKALPASFRENLQDDTNKSSKNSRRASTNGSGTICLLFTIMSRWFQKRLPCSCPCVDGNGDDVDVDGDGQDDIREID